MRVRTFAPAARPGLKRPVQQHASSTPHRALGVVAALCRLATLHCRLVANASRARWNRRTARARPQPASYLVFGDWCFSNNSPIDVRNFAAEPGVHRRRALCGLREWLGVSVNCDFSTLCGNAFTTATKPAPATRKALGRR